MSLSPSAALARFVLNRVASLLRTPNGWGPPHAVELQLLLLVEAWHVAQGAPEQQVDATTTRFARFLGYKLPGPPVPLTFRLGLDHEANDRFVEILREFVTDEMQFARAQALVREAGAPPLSSRLDRDGPRHTVPEA